MNGNMMSFMYIQLLGITLVIAVYHVQFATGRCLIPEIPNHSRLVYPSRYGAVPGYVVKSETVRVVCDENYELVNGDGYMMCQRGGVWSASFSCREQYYCGHLRTVKNGRIRYHGIGQSKIARFFCNPGYELIGQRKRFCLSNQTWSGERSTCRGKPRCENPILTEGLRMEVTSGEQVADLWRYKSCLAFSCERGYAIQGATELTCIRQWDEPVPQCIALTCDPLLENITHGYSTARNKTYKDSQTIFYYCDDGYVTSSQSWRVCVVTRTTNGGTETSWSGVTPRCEEITCARPGRMENGVSIVLSNSIGGYVTFRCNSGFELIGSSKIICTSNGRWNASIPVCSDGETFCEPLSSPLNGRKTGSRYDRYFSVQFECNSNYVLIGSSARSCMEDGYWSGENTRCIGSQDFDDVNQISAVFGQMIDVMGMDAVSGNVINTTDRTGRFIPLSHETGVDLYFMFDASESVGKTNFNLAKEFAKGLINEINVTSSRNSLRVGAISFSSNTYVQFHTTAFETTKQVLNAIDGIEYIGHGTNIAKAFDIIRTVMIPQTAALNRPDSYKTVFLITDGEANEGGDPDLNARALEKEGFKIHCLGISQNASRLQLVNVASFPLDEHLFFIENFHSLTDVIQAVTNQTVDYSACGDSPASKTRSAEGARGDVPANAGAWPWQAKISIQRGRAIADCGGSLIARKWILTAAHCIETPEEHVDQTIIVKLGLTEIMKTAYQQTFQVLRSIVHPDFVPGTTYNYDIALLELDREAILNPYVKTVCLPDPEKGDKLIPPIASRRQINAIATGWGHPDPVRKNDPAPQYRTVTHLQQLGMPLKTREQCRESLDGDEQADIFSENMFCAGYLNVEAGLCQGDSGGPLVRNVKRNSRFRWTIIGITSWGVGCQQRNELGFFTHVPRLMDWVINTMQTNNEEHEEGPSVTDIPLNESTEIAATDDME